MLIRILISIVFLIFTHVVSAQVCRVSGDHVHLVEWTPHISITSNVFPKRIGLAFHVLHQGGQENVSLESIQAQVDVLNERFMGTEFSFYLAMVTRTQNADWVPLSNEGVPSKTIRDALLVDPDHVINVFIGDMVDGAIGWSVFADSSDPQSHAIVLDFVALPGGPFDPDFDTGITLVHEMGHYFSLRHPYERGCLEDPTKGDFVGDTPPAAESWFRQCPTVADSCPTLPGSDPVTNYMYATTDACRVTWSPGQIDRMQQKITEFKPDIGGASINLPDRLTIMPNSEWYFYEGTYRLQPDTPLTVQGTLHAQHVAFTAREASWQGIHFEPGSEGQLVDVQINNIAGAAAVMLDDSEATLDSVEVDVLPESTTEAILVMGAQSTLRLSRSYITQNANAAAVKASDGGTVHFGPDASTEGVGLNRIAGGALFATTDGVINAGLGPNDRSYNHFCDEASAQLVTSEGGIIYATHNYWYNDIPPSLTGAGIVYNNKLGASDCSDIPVVDVQVERPLPSPREVYLLSNQPNPFTSSTVISFRLPSAGYVRLIVYDLLGRPVKTLVDGFQPAGPHEVVFDGSFLSNGPYAYRLLTERTSLTKMMIVSN